MDARIIETLENLEDKIESIKWMLAASLSSRRNGISGAMKIIRKSCGILKKGSVSGVAFENRIRKNWKADFLKRPA